MYCCCMERTKKMTNKVQQVFWIEQIDTGERGVRYVSQSAAELALSQYDMNDLNDPREFYKIVTAEVEMDTDELRAHKQLRVMQRVAKRNKMQFETDKHDTALIKIIEQNNGFVYHDQDWSNSKKKTYILTASFRFGALFALHPKLKNALNSGRMSFRELLNIGAYMSEDRRYNLESAVDDYIADNDDVDWEDSRFYRPVKTDIMSILGNS